MASLFFGFKDLVNSYPSGKSIFDLSSTLINDKSLKSINPKRYNFYIKFVNGLANPIVLEKFFYKTKESKIYKEELNEKLAKFADLIRRINTSTTPDDANKIKESIVNVVKNRYNLSDDVTDKLKDLVSGGAEFLNKGEQPMQGFINEVNQRLPEITPKTIKSINDLIVSPTTNKDETSSKGVSRTEMITEAEKIYNTYRDEINPNRMEIKLLDRVVFIITTFVIRIITLIIIQWGLDTNLINSFYKAFNYYCFIYLLIFAFITMFVNVVIAYPIVDLFSTRSIINIPNLFYYFYIYTNGSIRLLLHIVFILIILFIPYVISVDKFNLRQKNKEDVNISTDQEKKKKIYDTISLFSLIIWILTSIVALKF